MQADNERFRRTPESIGNPQSEGLKVARVEVHESRSGIPVEGWDNASQIIDSRISKVIEKIHERKNKLLEAARNSVDAGAHWSGNFNVLVRREEPGEEYVDWPPPFSSFLEDLLIDENSPKLMNTREPTIFSSTYVAVEKASEDSDTYVIYLIDDDQEELAQELGVKPILHHTVTRIELQPEGDTVRINFDDALKRLQDPRLPHPINLTISGKDAAQHFMDSTDTKITDHYYDYYSASYPEELVIGEKDGVEVLARIRVNRRRYIAEPGKTRPRKAKDTWHKKGAVLTCPIPAQTQWGDEDDENIPPPSISFSVRPIYVEQKPAIPELKQRASTIEAVTQSIVTAFTPQLNQDPL